MPKSSIFFPMNDIASIEFCIWFSSLFISFFQTHHFWTYFLIKLPQWNPTWGDFAGENFWKTSSNYILLILLSALSVIRHRIYGNNLDWLLNLATEMLIGNWFYSCFFSEFPNWCYCNLSYISIWLKFP